MRICSRGPEARPPTDPPLGGRCPLWRGPATAGRAAPQHLDPRSSGPSPPPPPSPAPGRRAGARVSGSAIIRPIAALPRIYVTGHRNPDTDSVASAIGYAELMG